MRKRTFGRWATRLALLAAVGVGIGAAGALAGVGSSTVLADFGWQVASIQVDGGETAL
jgi:hypothetical protein